MPMQVRVEETGDPDDPNLCERPGADEAVQAPQRGVRLGGCWLSDMMVLSFVFCSHRSGSEAGGAFRSVLFVLPKDFIEEQPVSAPSKSPD
jgi:hypothetical protein